MHESKDNQPDSFRDASVTRREMETLERNRRIEMERREQHIRDEFKGVQVQVEVLAGKFEDVPGVADKMEEMWCQNEHLQSMVQQIIANKTRRC